MSIVEEQGGAQTPLARAVRKLRSGAPLTQAEERAYKKAEKSQREKYGIAFVRDMPKGVFLRETGANNKTLLELAGRFGLPWGTHERTFDALAFVAGLFGLIAEYKHAFYKAIAAKKSRPSVEEFLPDMPVTQDWQEECWREKALALRDERFIREGELLDAGAHAEIMARIADGWRDFAERLGRDFGPDAQRLFFETWSNIESDVHRLLDADGNSSPTQPT